MQDIDEIKEAARRKLVGYTDKEIECFVEGAKYMAGHIPQRRSDEWYRQQAERKQAGISRQETVCALFQKASGLKESVDAINNQKTEGEIINHAFAVLFENIASSPELKAMMLDLLDAEDKSVSQNIIESVRIGIKGFNDSHEVKLDFCPDEDNPDLWTLYWIE